MRQPGRGLEQRAFDIVQLGRETAKDFKAYEKEREGEELKKKIKNWRTEFLNGLLFNPAQHTGFC